MARMRRFAAGLAALLRRRRADRDLDDELRAYLDAAAEDKIRAGLPRAAAVQAARAEMGSIEAVKDHMRDAGWEAHAAQFWRDIRYAARTLRKSLTFSVVAIGTLALGIGANSAIFSVVNALMLRPLPVDRPHELISLATVYPDNVEAVFSYAAYRRFAGEAEPVADLLAASSVRRDAGVFDSAPEPIDCKWVSGNYFAVLGVAAAVGRTLVPADDTPQAGERAAVLSDAYWTRRFGRDPSVVGRTLRLKNVPFTIVGVGPRGFFGETGGEGPDIWAPMTTQPGAPSFLWTGHSTTWLGIVARVRSGVSVLQVRQHLDATYGRVREEVAQGTESAEFRRSVEASRLAVSSARSGSSRLRGPLSPPLFVLMALVGLVLVIACANVANLMLARNEARRRDIAVCMAIGAGRWRVVRQAFAEAVLLASAAGVCGLGVAFWLSSVLTKMVSGALPLAIDATPDVRVLAFTIALSCATAFIFGLAPALRAGRIDPLAALKGSGAGPGQRIRLRRLLVVTQVAVSLVLLVAAGLFVRSLREIRNVDMGFQPDGVLVIQVTAPAAEPSLTAEEKRQIYREMIARAETVPGVQAASAAFSGLLGREAWRNAIHVDGYVPPSGTTPRTFVNAVSPRYFEVMRMPLISGRRFTQRDDARAPGVTVVNQTFARQFLGGQDALGRYVTLCRSEPCGRAPIEIVGVAADAKYTTLREEKRPMLYVPLAQHTQNPREIEVRTSSDPIGLAAALHRELSAVDSRVAVVRMMAMRDQVDGSIAAERMVATLSAAFGLLALTLAAIGLYGVVAYVTARRTGEIGIRMALGAGRPEVRRLVLQDTAMLVLTGMAIGVPLALAGSRLLAGQLYGVSAYDPLALSAALMVLTISALLAGYLPARRAVRVDPLAALRVE
jgi:predicted permease